MMDQEEHKRILNDFSPVKNERVSVNNPSFVNEIADEEGDKETYGKIDPTGVVV